MDGKKPVNLVEDETWELRKKGWNVYDPTLLTKGNMYCMYINY